MKVRSWKWSWSVQFRNLLWKKTMKYKHNIQETTNNKERCMLQTSEVLSFQSCWQKFPSWSGKRPVLRWGSKLSACFLLQLVGWYGWNGARKVHTHYENKRHTSTECKLHRLRYCTHHFLFISLPRLCTHVDHSEPMEWRVNVEAKQQRFANNYGRSHDLPLEKCAR